MHPPAEFVVRPYCHDDIPDLYAAVRASLAHLSPWMPWCSTGYSEIDAVSFVLARAELRERGEEYDFAIVETSGNHFVGSAGINRIQNQDRLANLGYWVHVDWCGRGAATRAARQVARFGFTELGLARLEIVVDIDNRPSQRVAEKLGAQREGVMRRRLWRHDQPRDAVLYSLLPEDLGE